MNDNHSSNLQTNPIKLPKKLEIPSHNGIELKTNKELQNQYKLSQEGVSQQLVFFSYVLVHFC